MRAPARPLRDVLTARRGPLIVGVLFLAVWQAAEATVPVVVGLVIDRAITTGDASALAAGIGGLAAVFAVLSLGYRFGARLGARAVEEGALRLRLALGRRILHPAGGAGRGRLPGELVAVATTDVTRTAQVGQVLGMAVIATSGLTVASVVLLRTSPQLGLIVLLGLPPVLLTLNLLARPLERRSAAEQEHAALATARAADLVTGLRVLQGIGGEAAATARYRSASRAALTARLRATRWHALHSGLTVCVTNGFLALVALVGGRQAAQGDISIGELVAALGLTQYLVGPLSWLGATAAEFARCRASARRIADVLDQPGTPPPAAPGRPAPGPGANGAPAGLHIAGLTHGPLRGLDLAVRDGEILGVVVPDPAAAAALLACLALEEAPAAGHVAVRGRPLAELDLDAARAAVLVAAHDADLFEDTVDGNVALTAAGPDRVPPAMRAAAADEVVTSRAGDGTLAALGASLSGGQRQRVALARALAVDAPVLVLHEPTTAVDAVTEARIADGIRRLRADRTTLVVTTSPALLAVADRVAVVVEGRVAALGAHGTLLADSPAYRRAVLS